MESNDQVVLFDGICNLCNKLVIFIIKRDPHATIKFATLQSESGKKIMASSGFSKNTESIAFISNGKYYRQSTAVLHILKTIGGIWKLLFIFILLPKPIRDFFYNIIARNRYRIFGKRDACMVPSPEIINRFLS